MENSSNKEAGQDRVLLPAKGEPQTRTIFVKPPSNVCVISEMLQKLCADPNQPISFIQHQLVILAYALLKETIDLRLDNQYPIDHLEMFYRNREILRGMKEFQIMLTRIRKFPGHNAYDLHSPQFIYIWEELIKVFREAMLAVKLNEFTIEMTIRIASDLVGQREEKWIRDIKHMESE